ncbi:MAG TPA: protein kinase [Candidatus Angelobacter sp.]|nr:protein kinase [Candidatus Angelobacter sp.]
MRIARELEPGMIVRGKYIILEWIGAGGMAVVYRARHRLLNEMRAVKVVSAKFAGDEDFLWRFRHEAAIARRLRHENAVWVEDLDEIEDGRPFIAMEFLQGDDLRKLIKDQGPLSVERCIKLGSQVASALGAAHRLGIIHRDIKPDNIFVTRDSTGNEVAKVLDFGIAKAKEGALQGGLTATKTGVIIGTPEYMSPEQAEGQLGDQLDGRADLYALGVVLYEMLTGQLPFKSDTPLGMCLHHLQTPPRPPNELRPDLRISDAVSAVLMKALEKRRERRFQSAEEMSTALRNPAEWAKTRAQNGAGAFTPTRVARTQPSKEESTASIGLSTAAAAVAQGSTATKPSRPALAAASYRTVSPNPAALKTDDNAGSIPTPTRDTGRRWRIAIVVLSVIVFAIAGYFLLKANERHNAALRAHDSTLRDLIVQKLQSSLALQGRSNNITVAVNSDVVTLAGNVSLPADKEEAATEARTIPGVSDVTNNIVVTGTPDLAKQPAPTDTGNSTSAPEPAVRTQTRTTRLPARQKNSNSSRANELVQSGNAALDEGNYTQAISDFQAAMQLDSGNTAASSGLQRARNAQKAEEDVRRKTQQP